MKVSNKLILICIIFTMTICGHKYAEDSSFVDRYIAFEDSSFADRYIAYEDSKVSCGSKIVCQIDGNIDNAYADMVEHELIYIPSSLRRKFVEDGWHIYVTNENLTEEYAKSKDANILGVTFYPKDLILVSANDNAIKEATVHEFGHWFDEYVGYPSTSKEFAAIHSNEKSIFMHTFRGRCSVEEAKEYFAEAFYFYIKAPNYLKKAAPQTYAYINYYVLAVMQE